MNDVLKMLGSYLLLTLTVVTVENAVFTRAMGLSRIISLVDNITSTMVFCSLLTVSTTISGIIYYFLYHSYVENMSNALIYRVVAVVLSMSVSYILVFIVAIKIMPYEHIGKAAEAMPTATFNCMVFGTIFLAGSEQMTLGKTIVFCIASSIGYAISILLVTEGQRKLQSRDIPAAFKGLPATLLYLAGLAMAIYGLTGRGFSV